MHYPTQAAAFAAFSLLSAINATPVLPRAVDCSTDGSAAVCWKQLEMTYYMNNDFGKYGTCNVNRTKGLKWSWSKCFLDFAGIKPAMDCSDLQSTTCKKPIMNVKAEPYYGAFNIWSTWSYISSWAKGIEAIAAKNPEILVYTAQPNQFVIQDPIQNIDVALTNMIRWTDRFDKATNDAFIAFMEANYSVHIYDANKSTGVNIGNQLQQRLAELLEKLSTNLPSFIKLVEGGEFSRNPLYNEQTIEDRFMPQFDTQATVDAVVPQSSIIAGISTVGSVPTSTSMAAAASSGHGWLGAEWAQWAPFMGN